MTADDLSRHIADAARSLEEEIGSQHTMERGLQLALEMIEGCEHAGISLIRRGQIDSPAFTDAVVKQVDRLQYEHREGPCIDAIMEAEVVHSRDLARDERWPVWGPITARETGIQSMMCFRLFTTGDTVGAMNLYSSTPGSFTAEDREHGLALAAHLALAYVASQQIESLGVALDSRTMIGQATGILMERFDMSPDRAFAVLRRVSQHSNRKLREVAHELVVTRVTPSE